eukprot:10559-Heterococcus_DN1.PRE.2
MENGAFQAQGAWRAGNTSVRGQQSIAAGLLHAAELYGIATTVQHMPRAHAVRQSMPILVLACYLQRSPALRAIEQAPLLTKVELQATRCYVALIARAVQIALQGAPAAVCYSI